MFNLKNKTLLITGGTGSFGQNFTKYLLKKHNELKKIIILSRDELKQYNMQNQFTQKENNKLRFFLGDIRDKDRIYTALENVDAVVHAAALKQVSAAEYNPIEFIKTNVIGAQNIIECCIERNVNNVVALSTDKAVAPINLYGATKLCFEKLFISANNISGNKDVRFCVVRYGNVFGSRGSVYPYFESIKNKGFFPITDLSMTRFNISLKESIELVLWTIKHNIGGEIFIPKLPSYKILDLAKTIQKKNKIKVIGIRPGEKIHEELISETESANTYDLGKCYAIIQNPPLKIKKNFYKKIKNRFSYNSGKNNAFLSGNELKKIIIDHKKYITNG